MMRWKKSIRRALYKIGAGGETNRPANRAA